MGSSEGDECDMMMMMMRMMMMMMMMMREKQEVVMMCVSVAEKMHAPPCYGPWPQFLRLQHTKLDAAAMSLEQSHV